MIGAKNIGNAISTKADRKIRVFEKTCAICGVKFIGHSWNATYCIDCKEIAMARNQKKRKKTYTPKKIYTPRPACKKICAVCGAEFIGRNYAKYCPECRSHDRRVYSEERKAYRKKYRKSCREYFREYLRNWRKKKAIESFKE